MSSIFDDDEQKEGISETLNPVRHLLFCPNCKKFERTDVVLEDDIAILVCSICDSEERWPYVEGIGWIPEGFNKVLDSFVVAALKTRFMEVQRARKAAAG